MTQSYLVFTILLVFVALNAAILIGLSHLVAPRRPTPLKGTPYESGMPPLGSARERFSVKFYLVAMLFIVFDIETVFLVPWAVMYRSLGLFGLIEMLVFMALLGLGFLYAWKRGGLDWE